MCVCVCVCVCVHAGILGPRSDTLSSDVIVNSISRGESHPSVAACVQLEVMPPSPVLFRAGDTGDTTGYNGRGGCQIQEDCPTLEGSLQAGEDSQVTPQLPSCISCTHSEPVHLHRLDDMVCCVIGWQPRSGPAGCRHWWMRPSSSLLWRTAKTTRLVSPVGPATQEPLQTCPRLTYSSCSPLSLPPPPCV